MRSLFIGIVLCGLIAAPAMACGPAAKGESSASRVVAELDEHLAKAKPSDEDLARIKDLRAQIETFVAAKNLVQARNTQEEAMRIIGYRKALLRCGPGSYSWIKVG